MIGFLRTLFLESLVLLIMAEVAAVAIVLAVYRRRSPSRSRLPLVVALAICALLIGIQSYVQTDREQIESAVEQMARAIDEGDVPTLGEHLDRDFQDRNLDKAAWLQDVRQRLQRWRIDEARVGRFSTEVQGDTATVVFAASCDWRGPGESQSAVNSTWKLGFIHRDDGWKLQRVLSAKFGPGGIMDYATILQY